MIDPYDWLTEPVLQRPTVLGLYDGFSNIMLFKIPSGALLWWMFEDEESESLGVFVHLTDAEAQAVYSSRHDGGLLEPVRAQLTDRHAVVWSAKGGEVRSAEPFLIDGRVSEDEFSNRLWDAAESSRDRGGILADAKSAFQLMELAA